MLGGDREARIVLPQTGIIVPCEDLLSHQAVMRFCEALQNVSITAFFQQRIFLDLLMHVL